MYSWKSGMLSKRANGILCLIGNRNRVSHLTPTEGSVEWVCGVVWSEDELVLYVAQFLAEISDKNGVETKAGDSVVGSGRVSKVDGW